MIGVGAMLCRIANSMALAMYLPLPSFVLIRVVSIVGLAEADVVNGNGWCQPGYDGDDANQ